jgi:alpha-galactosidase
MVMFSNPLGWFEASNLPEAYVESCSALVRIWKAHREDLFSGTMFPIGQEPDGYSYTGFMSLSPSGDHGYVVLFRELHGESSAAIPIPSIGPEAPAWELLSGEGTIAGCGASLQATIPKPLGFVFARFAR